jgi:hypothetical protein
MRRAPIVTAVVCGLSLAWLAEAARAELVITEVMSSSAHPAGSANGDWWELTNTGELGISLDNYSWDDSDGIAGTSIFPSGLSIAAGESVLIVDEPVANVEGFRLAWDLVPTIQVFSEDNFIGPVNFSGLGAGGDEVNLYDAALQLVASVTFGQATLGRSFEWGQNGSFLGLSTVGENGAYVAEEDGAGDDGIDVGSPGLSVVGLPTADLVITEVMSSSSHPAGDANGDWWELTNRGTVTVSLDGHSWQDRGGATLGPFPAGTELAPGESILIVDEPATNINGFVEAWDLDGTAQVLSRDDFGLTFVFPGLSGEGDQVNVFGPAGDVVTSVAFGNAGTGGASFEWDRSGNSLGVSVAGENGAFVATGDGAGGTGTDVGSPSVSVSGGGPLLGDLDCDDDVDFDDISAFVLGLNDPVAYEEMFGVPSSLKGDIDGDGDLDFDDISGFVALLSAGQSGGVRTAAVPEPSSLVLALAGVIAAGVVALVRR